MKCLMLIGRQESCQVSQKNHLFYPFVIQSLYLSLLLSICSPSVIQGISKLFIDSIHILFLLYLLFWFGFLTSKPAGFHQNH